MLGQKINKNRPNILQKTILKTMPQLGWILGPTWLYFGKVLGAKMGPSWFQMALNIDPKANQKHDHFLNACKIEFLHDFWLQLGGSRGVQLSAFGSLFVLLEPSWGQDGPRWRQDGPKRSQDASKTPRRGLMGPILVDFGFKINGFWFPCWLNSRPHGTISGRYWLQNILVPSLVQFSALE